MVSVSVFPIFKHLSILKLPILSDKKLLKTCNWKNGKNDSAQKP